MRSTRSIEILCLSLAALVLIWSRAIFSHTGLTLALLGAFCGAILAFRSQRLFRNRTRLRLLVESWSMMAFVTGVLYLTGRSVSPMLNLYLLPVILSALTLGRLVTLLQVGAICAIHLVLALATPGVQVLSLAVRRGPAIEAQQLYREIGEQNDAAGPADPCGLGQTGSYRAP